MVPPHFGCPHILLSILPLAHCTQPHWPCVSLNAPVAFPYLWSLYLESFPQTAILSNVVLVLFLSLVCPDHGVSNCSPPPSFPYPFLYFYSIKKLSSLENNSFANSTQKWVIKTFHKYGIFKHVCLLLHYCFDVKLELLSCFPKI
jgi:hypothetical protein